MSWTRSSSDELLVPGRVNALAQAVLKLTLPGVPDVYQGTELWDLRSWTRTTADRSTSGCGQRSCRRSRRARRTRRGRRCPAESGIAKLWLTHRALDLRARRPEASGRPRRYAPLLVTGPEHGPSALGFARGDESGEAQVVVVVPRPSAAPGRGPDPAVTVAIPDGRWRDVSTGALVAAAPGRCPSC